MVTAKQQNEFRIQLQKKACRRAEKRVEVLEDDVSWKEVRTSAIRTVWTTFDRKRR